MVTKRAHIDIDPDYEDVTEHQSKRQRFLEQDAKETTRRKIEAIIRKQVSIEIRNKEVEIDNVDRALSQARIAMDRLRACIIANYYGSAGQQRFSQGNPQQTPSIHPAVKDSLGKRPRDHPVEVKQEPASGFVSTVIKSEPVTSEAMVPSVTLSNTQNATVKMETDSGCLEQSTTGHTDSRTARFKVKKRIIVGNVSKYIPVDRRDENDQSTHKWMVYVRGSREEPKIDHFVKKVWFFLHPSYRPNDLVEVSVSPFHLTRRGWGEFPVRVQLHFKDQRNKRLDIIHQLKLDRTYTGLQTLGSETVVDIELEKDRFDEKLAPSVSLNPHGAVGSTSLLGKNPGNVSIKQENNITITEQISPRKVKVEDSVLRNHMQGKLVPNGTSAMLSDKENQLKIEFKPSTEAQNASKNTNKIVIDASNQSLQSVVTALINNPSSLVQSGNIMVLQNVLSQNKQSPGTPAHSLVIGPTLQGGNRASPNIKAETSASSSKVSAKQAVEVTKTTAPSGAQSVLSMGGNYSLIKSVSPEKGKSSVKSVNSGIVSVISPGDTKSSSLVKGLQINIANAVTQSVTVSPQQVTPQAATNAKQPTVLSSSVQQKSVPIATNSVSRQAGVHKAATQQQQQLVQPVKQNVMLSTKQQSVTVPTLQQTVTTATSSKSVAMTTTSSLQSTTASTSSQSTAQTFYVRCKDNQGNIFLVPHHLLKQVSQTATMATTAGGSPANTATPPTAKTSLLTSPDAKKNVAARGSTSALPTSTVSQNVQTTAQNVPAQSSLCIRIEPQSQPQSTMTTVLSAVLPHQSAAPVGQPLLTTSSTQQVLAATTSKETASVNVKSGTGPLLFIKTDQPLISGSHGNSATKAGTSTVESSFSLIDGKLVQNISSTPSQLQLHLQGQITPSVSRTQSQLKVTSEGLKNVLDDVKSKILKGLPSAGTSSLVKSEVKAESKIPSKSCQLASLLKGDISAAHRNAKAATAISQSSSQVQKEASPLSVNAQNSSQGQTSLLALNSRANPRQSLLLMGQEEKKPVVAKSLVSGKAVTSWNTQGTRPISGQSILTNLASGKVSNTVVSTSVTNSISSSALSSPSLTLTKGQVNPAVQSKTVLAKIGNQTLLLQLPVTDISPPVTAEKGKLQTKSEPPSVTMTTTKTESQRTISKVTPISDTGRHFQDRQLSNFSAHNLDDEKRILNWKKKKCYLTAPVPVKEIPPIKVNDYPDVASLIRAAIKRHPIISVTADLFQHPYCAREREQWLSWNVGKRRSSEWQRASSCRKYLIKQLNGEMMFKGEKLWTTKQIMCWCRLHAYSPHYLEKTLHPDSADLVMKAMVSKKLTTMTGVDGVLGHIDNIQTRWRKDSSGDEDVDITSIEPPKVKIKQESPVKETAIPSEVLPPSAEALFVQDISQKIGVKFDPCPVDDVVHAPLAEDVVFSAMKSFIGEVITEAFALKVNMGRYPDGLGVTDIYKALSALPQADFLTNKHLGVKDFDR